MHILYSSFLSWHSHAATRVCSCIFVQLLRPNLHVTRELSFVQSTRALFRVLHKIHLCVLHDCKKHASNTSCAARESVFLCAARDSVFLCAAHKLTAILYQRRIKAYNEMARQKNMIRHVDTKKIIFCQVFTYCCSNSLWMTLYQTNLNAKHNNGTRFRQHEH